MKLMHLTWLPGAIFICLIFARMFLRGESSFFKWVEQHWFFKRSIVSKATALFYLVGVCLLVFSLLDLRGGEAVISTDIPEQRTILMLDTSASMLVEDIRPNRFKKALLLSRHFVKSAVGHQVSVILFSDNHKKLVPFTDDVDLLEARISALEEMDIKKGGSNIGQSIQEALQYLRTNEPGAPPRGNLLILTDGEENEENFPAEIPESVSVALVGIGTMAGGPIPLRDRSGGLIRYKKFANETVTSKLNEDFFRQFEQKFKNSKYWPAASYTIPTEEILSFFQGRHLKRFQSGEMRIRPVRMEWIVVPAILFLTISSLFRLGRTFIGLIFLLNIFSFHHTLAQDPAAEKQVDPIIAQKIEKYSARLKEGDLDRDQELDLAYYLLKSGQLDLALAAYEEGLSGRKMGGSYDAHFFNYGTAMLQKKELGKGIDLLGQLYWALPEAEEELKKKIRENILTALSSQNQQNQNQDQSNQDQQQENEQKRPQDNQDNQNENKDKNDQNENDNSDQKEQKDKDEKNDNKNQDRKEQEKKGQNENKDKKEKQNDKDQNRNKQDQKKSEQPPEGAKRKVPALLKQLLNDDRKVQEKILDPSTYEKRGREYKDW